MGLLYTTYDDYDFYERISFGLYMLRCRGLLFLGGMVSDMFLRSWEIGW